MSVALRPYQSEAISNTKRAIARLATAKKPKRVMVCAPTGSGKTLTAGAIILGAHDKGSRVLFVAHRKELIDQSVKALYRLGLTAIGVIRAGDKRADLSQPIQVASIQTLSRRVKLKDPPHIIFIDEAHRASAKGYQTHLYEAYPDAIIIGLSATPCRADNKPLGAAFEELIPVASYSELIACGFIDEPLVYSTPVLPDMSTVRTENGDFNKEDLEAAMSRGAIIGSIGDEWKKHNGGRRTVVFAVSVAHSKALVDMFRSIGATAEHLDGETPEEEREAILKRVDTGETQVVCNCNVLSEGWDQPSVKCLVLARPTKSLSLYMQQGGRVLRPWGNVQPIILDHAGNVDRHGLPHEDREWSLDAKPKRKTDGAPPSKMCKACFAYVANVCRKCPHCGAEFETASPDVAKKEPVPVDLELRTVAQHTADKRFGTFQTCVSQCRRKGWKYGAAVHQWRRMYKEDPPAAWIEALKKDYRRDVEWKERVKRVEAEREERAQREAEREAREQAAFLRGSAA